MFAVRGGRSFFLWCRHWTTANHRSADRLAGAIASASRNDRAHSVKLTLGALTLGVNAEAKCAISASPSLTQRHVLCVSALFFIIGAASSSRNNTRGAAGPSEFGILQPSKDIIVVASDLNGHVGATKDGYSCHGGFGYGSRCADDERILHYAKSPNLTIVNTVFGKRDSHLISYYSRSTKAQKDFVLVRDRERSLVTDAKIVPYETVAQQHRPLSAL
ncbi:unnamed protein product [Heligmosomoides polygyrus]|uniref:Endo/exonuclease/phosphatase domain-containing protein n=1 Tax=Heligmosomoides polygyrus TaxID=6339 RepID=A0A183F3I4_HELPZ|nr:unnamed protein product [Heligmosomoides polygyrus]